MILDTNFVIDFLQGNESASNKITELNKKKEILTTTTITIFELWQGLRIKTAEKKEKLLQFIESIGVLVLDFESAKKGGEINSELISKGIRIDPEDSMIAGIAIQKEQTLLTKDEHFARIKGIRIETYCVLS